MKVRVDGEDIELGECHACGRSASWNCGRGIWACSLHVVMRVSRYKSDEEAYEHGVSDERARAEREKTP